jgi:hypothetical protein
MIKTMSHFSYLNDLPLYKTHIVLNFTVDLLGCLYKDTLFNFLVCLGDFLSWPMINLMPPSIVGNPIVIVGIIKKIL